MSSALLNLSRSVQELTEENQSLKEDLDRLLSNSPTISKMKGAQPVLNPQGRMRVLPGRLMGKAMGQVRGQGEWVSVSLTENSLRL